MLETSGQLITLEDVAFGDVWVCSGQSNMVLKVSVRSIYSLFL